MTGTPKLVIGANGFLGSHVTRQLVATGAEVRVIVRPTSNTRTIDDLAVERFHGDLFDTTTLTKAMDGCDVVYHCAVDTRAWLRDPSPLFRANVEGLRNVLDIARRADLKRFVFTSSYVTIGRKRGRRATEGDKYTWRRSDGPYPLSRLQAEELVLRYADEFGLPAVAMCVATTYGAGDWGGTPHGAFIAGTVLGKLPFLMDGISLEVVGVDDAARALLLAAEHGRNGERYIISEKMLPLTDVVRIAADEVGVRPPSRSIPLPALYGLGALGSLKVRFSGSEGEQLSLKSVRMMRAEAELDHTKATQELGWHPQPVEDSIRAAARFWMQIAQATRKSKAAQPDG
jgi:dihydroflavonol-4-reductase